MKCSETQSQVDDYLDNLLEANQRAEVDLHLVSCRLCQGALIEERKLRDNLRSLPVPELSNGFADRAVRVALQSTVTDQHRSAYMKGFGSAVAAGLCIWFLIGLFPSKSLSPLLGYKEMGDKESQTAALNIQVIGIGLHQMRKIKLAFHTLKAMNGATISIKMPDNFAIVGYEGQQKLEWQTDLVKGDNVLILPIKAMADDAGELVAQIKYANQVKTIKINLAVERPSGTEPSVFERTEGRLTVV